MQDLTNDHWIAKKAFPYICPIFEYLLFINAGKKHFIYFLLNLPDLQEYT